MKGPEYERITNWIEAHGGRLHALARAMTDNAAEAEDLLQDAWVVAVQRSHVVRDAAHVGPWLQRIVINLARARWRKSKRRHRLLSMWLPGFEGSPIDPPPADDNTSDVHRQVWQAIAQLPDLQRRVLMYRIVDELSTTETATVIDRAEGTVKASLHRALKTLKEALHSAPAPASENQDE